MRQLLLSTALGLTLLPLGAQALEPFSAQYTADWQQVPVSGSAQRELKRNSDGSWTLTFRASMLVAGLTEESRFTEDGPRFVPLSYRFERSGLGKGKTISHDFDWSARRVTGKDRKHSVDLPLENGLLDKSTYQLALQQDVARGKTSMSYQVLDGDEVEVFDFRVLGRETVSTEVGQVEAIKVERVRDPTQSSRKTELWFAPNWNHLLVRLHQRETDGKEYQIMLKQATLDGQPLKGR
ncbi:DUF3108 domain-containing protein [Pseudomonas sp. NW5]|uniref:DUF3108 domain-containing protein n=1 Tax=Pseudomonas sp. NW5 TaxID=2934934 RepID=UPI002022029A|nr:DUF3108 domain-containing protein [Pseudomonas sp. NW5]MCL7462335.1 DUF3108 domain-containing protein [Pseudomonas sp. NW5]